MIDDAELTGLGNDAQVLFVLVEVKSSDNVDKIVFNKAWSELRRKNLQHVIRRLGFTSDENMIDTIAATTYRNGRWENGDYVFQHIMVAKKHNPKLQNKLSQLK